MIGTDGRPVNCECNIYNGTTPSSIDDEINSISLNEWSELWIKLINRVSPYQDSFDMKMCEWIFNKRKEGIDVTNL